MGRHGYGTFDTKKAQWKVRTRYLNCKATVRQLEQHFQTPIPRTKRGSRPYWLKFLFSHYRPSLVLQYPYLAEEIHNYYKTFSSHGAKRPDILRCLTPFLAIVGNIPLNRINSSHYRSFFQSLCSKGYSQTTLYNYRILLNAFLKSLCSNHNLSFPFITSKEFTFSPSSSPITYYTQEQLAFAMKHTTNNARLVFLFGINCGLYPSDIEEILPEHIHNGYLIKGRSKNKRYGVQKGAIGRWKLWPETLAMLPYLFARKRTRYVLRNAYLHFASRHNLPPSKYLRKTGAYLLQLHFDEETSRILYRAEATGTHYTSYVALDDAQYKKLDAALDWLRSYILLPQPPQGRSNSTSGV
jgi:hypothetical protein